MGPAPAMQERGPSVLRQTVRSDSVKAWQAA
ncbi:hypothetical protein P3T37_005986 [Kitasatospora sp. MAA4]|nr:hypothetical protein [Kitasatospora sp. MAA4]